MGFGDDIARFQDRSVRKLYATAFGFAFAIRNRVAVLTPKDTGAAAGDWQVVFDLADAAPTGVLGDDAVMPGLTPDLGPDGVIYVVNTKPYIRRLEHGHSQQGKHMVKITAAEAPDILTFEIAKADEAFR